ncbi:LLM class flavin-dependent oxidoreductase [Terrilactibacillus sp. S3-3]|nr:LLM class flavin-dependent oxidoreductase [Terrilactibacillus sp. S3-3]
MAPTSGDGAHIGKRRKDGESDAWTETDEREPSKAYILQVAKAAEKGGFSTLLLPTGKTCVDSLVIAAKLAEHTEKIRFLFAARPGYTSPAQFANQFSSLNYWSEGRANFNIVTGGSPSELAADGDFLDHDTRYRRTKEFITIVKKFFSEPSFDFEGEFYKLKHASLKERPYNPENVQVFFGGASDIALQVAAELADVYMIWGETLEGSKQQIEKVQKLASEQGRTLSYSISFQVILGDTEEEAWEKAHAFLDGFEPSSIEKKKELYIQKGDAAGVKHLYQLMEDSRQKDFKLGPNLWAGLAQVLSGNAIALVGTADQIADRIVEYVNLGFDKVLLRGYPHLEVIEQAGAQIIPRVKERLQAQKQYQGS